jgi:hypothetical protein
MTKTQMRKQKRKPTVDPIAVLEAIAGDIGSPATARVAAARALLAIHGAPVDEPVEDRVSTAALEILKKGK